MRTTLLLLATSVAATSLAQTPASSESLVRMGANNFYHLHNLSFNGTFTGVGSATLGAELEMVGAGYGSYWQVGNGLPIADRAQNAVNSGGWTFFWTTGESNGTTTLRFNRFAGVSGSADYDTTFPASIDKVIVRSSGSVLKSAWVVPGSPSTLHLMRHDLSPRTLVTRPVPHAARLVDFQVLPSGASFATTAAQNGWVHYFANFSKGGIRWTRNFPAGTLLKVDPNGHTYAVVPSPAGLTIRRFDFNGNHEGDFALPTHFGNQALDAATDSNGYLFVLTSSPINGRRVGQLVRLNPALTPRSHPLPGFLATGAKGQLEIDAWGQAYAVTATTTQGINTEQITALDTRSMLPLWQDSRTLAPGETPGNAFTTTGNGLAMWGNRPTSGTQRGYVRSYAETGFRSVELGGANITNGGGDGGLTIYTYGSVDRDRMFRLTSHHPDLTLPASVVMPAGQAQMHVPISIPQGSTRRNLRIDIEETETRQRRSASLGINPWVEPALMSATFVPNIVTGGQAANLRVWLADEGKGWTVAHLTASGTEIAVPTSIQLPEGKVVNLAFNTLPVAARVVRRVDVRVGTITKSDFLTIDP